MDKENELIGIILVAFIIIFMLFFLNFVWAADPVGPDELNVVANETKGSVSAKMINISGGRIATFNLSATVKNPRWKGFVGNVTGQFTLDDSSGSTIYDWTLSSITGRIYTTRNSTSVTWSSINCSNTTNLELENYRMNHTSPDDNITRTFNASYNTTINATVSGNHPAFWVGSAYMYANTCPVVHTYVNSAAQSTDFHETALYDGYNMVYATILEPNDVGFDGNTYDFQMIVPEIGVPSFAGATAYYIYVEIGT
jgi:hypothetical protein